MTSPPPFPPGPPPVTRLTRADLDALPSYVPGRNPADLAREVGVPEAIKLASNEVPYGPLPGVVAAIAEAAAGVHRYPDMGVVALREKLARRHGVSADRIATGCGSVAICEHLVRATCLPGDEVVYSWRSFEAYPIIVATAAATSVRVPNTAGHAHDLPAMAAAVTDRTRMVVVCNPNNPTGTAIRRAELDEFLAAVPQTVLVVLDEAYREFVTDPDVPDGIAEYGDRPNVAVLRTFSKAWGLAGLRAGFLVAQPAVAAAVRKVVTPFSTNGLAQAAALAALDASAEVRRRCELVIAERERLTDAVRKLVPPPAGTWDSGPSPHPPLDGADQHRLTVPDSQANFIWLPLGDAAAAFGAACEARGVIVRPFQGDGVRVTVGTPAENDAFLAAADASGEV